MTCVTIVRFTWTLVISVIYISSLITKQTYTTGTTHTAGRVSKTTGKYTIYFYIKWILKKMFMILNESSLSRTKSNSLYHSAIFVQVFLFQKGRKLLNNSFRVPFCKSKALFVDINIHIFLFKARFFAFSFASTLHWLHGSVWRRSRMKKV